MLPEIDTYFLNKDEPLKSCLLFLREHILNYDSAITEAWKYKMPFYCYKGKMFCYLWVHKKNGLPYIGFVEGKRLEHPELIIEKRSKMKILLIDPAADLSVHKIDGLLKMTISFYK